MTGLLVANLVSVAGSGLSLVALPWFVLATTGSTVATGVAALCETLPVVAFSLVAGAVVDRAGAMATRVGSDVVSAVTVLAIPALHATVGIAFWQLLVLMGLNGAVRAPAPAASLVLLNSLSDAAGSSGDRARATYSAGIRLASVAAAPATGTLIAWRGASAALVIDAVSFAASGLILTAAVRCRRPAELSEAAAVQRPWTGLALLAGDRVLAVLTVLVILLAVLSGAWNSVLAPAYGQRVLHSPTELGVLLGVFSAGALLGNLGYPAVAGRVDHHLMLWTCLGGGTVLGYGPLAATRSLPLLAAALLVAGIGVGLLGPFWLGLLTVRVAGSQHGHVFGVALAVEQAGSAIGAALAGLVLARLGITATLTAAASAGGVLTLFAALARPLQALHHTRKGPPCQRPVE